MTGEKKFALGEIQATDNALNRLTDKEIDGAINRHLSGDWGNVVDEDWERNNWIVENSKPYRLISVYKTANDVEFVAITDADRSKTTILLTCDY